MHSQSKYQVKDSQLLTNNSEEKRNTSVKDQGIPSIDNILNYDEEVNEEFDERLREEEEHYAFWLWEMFNK